MRICGLTEKWKCAFAWHFFIDTISKVTAVVWAECFMNSLCHSRACEIIITNCIEKHFIIRHLMSRGDKRCNKNVTTDRATIAIIPRHRYWVVCALSIFLDLVSRGEGMNYLDILFSPIRLSPSLRFLPYVCPRTYTQRTGITR